ncbi:M48 family metallopeptidase [Pseudoalteromonas sp. SSDWG2]|uniref:M48 family metallopeptidase n=1 Tax=Pseudoalteromonas sp. SSDWG2 TaxID=3139391 RepID=UPI003BAA7242
MQVDGIYYAKNQSLSKEVTLRLSDFGVTIYESGKTLAQYSRYQQGQQISGLPVDLNFEDGSRFVPHDPTHRWPCESKIDAMIESVEKHKVALLGCVIASVFLVWALFFKVIPGAATVTAKALPDSVVQSMSEQSLKAIEWAYLEPSQLKSEHQQHINAMWDDHIALIQDPPVNLKLHFYSAPDIGANAFALPDGQVILTDELALLLEDNDTALLSVLLHEIGHVEHQHGITLAAQSAGASVALALLFGDLEGFAEVIIGTGSTVLQQQFSRDMERQADTYALEQLSALGYSPAAFADAMRALAQAHDVEDENSSHLMRYLSSHPSMQERIKRAEDSQ